MASRAELPPYSILMIVDSHGSIFARTPESEKWVGKSAMTPLVKTLIEQKEGVTEAEDLDGVRLIERQEDEQLSMLSIEEACDTLIRILDEFLLFSRYRAGYLKLKKEPVDVGDWLRKTQRKYAGRSRQSKVSLEIDVEPGVGFISADREKLDRLVDNLVNNALKFTREEGQIELGARTAGDGVEFWVRDTGIGIAPDEAKSLFGKYQQADSAKAHQKQGTGLGLLICKMIAVEHGGQIRVEGELNQGTTFYVWIPRQSSDYLATGTVGWLGVASRILLT